MKMDIPARKLRAQGQLMIFLAESSFSILHTYAHETEINILMALYELGGQRDNRHCIFSISANAPNGLVVNLAGLSTSAIEKKPQVGMKSIIFNTLHLLEMWTVGS